MNVWVLPAAEPLPLQFLSGPGKTYKSRGTNFTDTLRQIYPPIRGTAFSNLSGERRPFGLEVLANCVGFELILRYARLLIQHEHHLYRALTSRTEMSAWEQIYVVMQELAPQTNCAESTERV